MKSRAIVIMFVAAVVAGALGVELGLPAAHPLPGQRHRPEGLRFRVHDLAGLLQADLRGVPQVARLGPAGDDRAHRCYMDLA